MSVRLEETKGRRVDEELRGEAGMDEAMARRERHRKRSIFVRAGVMAAGFGVGVVAALLSVVAPEFGLPLLLFGLRLLALEFDWAARLYTKVAKLAKKVAGKLRKFWPKSKVGVAMTVLALAAAVVILFVR
ncbi:MAG: hypothetical protein ACRDSJ_18760 [Rubrobacteraceae bacterium]